MWAELKKRSFEMGRGVKGTTKRVFTLTEERRRLKFQLFAVSAGLVGCLLPFAVIFASL